jgi:thiol-disulfide isomerase/thioredoxin
MVKEKTSSSSKGSSSDSMMEITLPDGISPFLIPLSILVSALIISGAVLYGAGKIAGDNGSNTVAGATDTNAGTGTDTAESAGTVVRTFETFTEYDNEVCKEDGKPVVYLFSTTWCPHCQWIGATFDKWAKDNSDKVVAYHWEVDTNDNTLTSEVETSVPEDALAVYTKFNPNQSIPTFVFGCRYSRVGNGYESENNLDKERESFDKVVNEIV